jgi:hypothetical protein
MGLESALKKDGPERFIPDSGFTPRNLLEIFVEGFYNLVEGILGHKEAPRFFPLTGSIFLYIVVSNLMGLIPGLLPATEKANTTLIVVDMPGRLAVAMGAGALSATGAGAGAGAAGAGAGTGAGAAAGSGVAAGAAAAGAESAVGHAGIVFAAGAGAAGAAGAAAAGAGAASAAFGAGAASAGADSAMVSALISAACCALHSGRSFSSCCAIRCRKSVPSRSWSMRAWVVFSWPFWIWTRTSSMWCATVTAASMPTMRAAPLMECAARMMGTMMPMSSGALSRRRRPSLSAAQWVSTSARKSSYIENPPRSLMPSLP